MHRWAIKIGAGAGRAGDTVDFLLTAKRDLAAARRFLERAINLHDVPEKITIDKSGANTAAIKSVKADACVDILMRQCKYLNNIVEQDHRAIKRITRPMLGFKSFWSARIIIAGIETMQMIQKGQIKCPEGSAMSAAQQFYSLELPRFDGHLIVKSRRSQQCQESTTLSRHTRRNFASK